MSPPLQPRPRHLPCRGSASTAMEHLKKGDTPAQNPLYALACPQLLPTLGHPATRWMCFMPFQRGTYLPWVPLCLGLLQPSGKVHIAQPLYTALWYCSGIRETSCADPTCPSCKLISRPPVRVSPCPRRDWGLGRDANSQESLDSARGALQGWLPGGNSEQMAGRAELTIP